jgi:hypothetical protein
LSIAERRGGTVDTVIVNWMLLIVAVISLLLVLLFETGREILRTLKRIDARLALTSPIEEEQKVFDEPQGFLVRAYIRDRALHPDVWFHQCFKERQGLRGTAYKEARKMQRYTERTRRS